MSIDKVLKLVEEARVEGSVKLDLSRMRLTQLPLEIEQLRRLQSLNLWGNHLTTLPWEIGRLRSLQILELGGNSFSTLPSCIAQLDNLLNLNLVDNLFSEIREDIGQLGSLKILSLDRNQLRTLPAELGQLRSLQRLSLEGNQLSILPAQIGQLRNLEELDLKNNHLKKLPLAIGQLGNLQILSLNRNQLRTLPAELGQLSSLQRLSLEGNQLSTLPAQTGQLSSLKTLDLKNNQLSTLPSDMGQLSNLQSTDLSNNKIRTLPAELGQLKCLTRLNLDNNPLSPALQAAYDRGIKGVLEYLKGVAENARIIYEAKLILIGEGEVGKTTLLKALANKKPRKNEPTTHGANVWPFTVHHPTLSNKNIMLNGWDFGGQEVYRATHQFFFSPNAIYLLIWKPREGVKESQIEYWLRTIRLRVGPEARVFIVSTHSRSGQRLARINKPELLVKYGDIIAGFHEVDSLVGDPQTGYKVGVAELKGMIAKEAAKLPQMGMVINRDWLAARDELLRLKVSKPSISQALLLEICSKHNLDNEATLILAGLLNLLGLIIYFDEEPLNSEVVLEPEWLTKAIGLVLEDGKTQEMAGILPDERLREVWLNHPFDQEPRFDPKFYKYFLRLMERFDVAYRFDDGTKSLVAQHVPHERPAFPWLPESPVAAGKRRVSLICEMGGIFPDGLIPWMIVRTHRWRHASSDGDTQPGLHWQKGMFLLRNKQDEAFIDSREWGLELHIEASDPTYFMALLQETVDVLIKEKWPGLIGKYWFSVPCKTMRSDGPCPTRFEIEGLRRAFNEGDQKIRCLKCGKNHNIHELLYGFRFEAAAIKQNPALYVWSVLKALASETREGPRLFTLEPVEDSQWYRQWDNVLKRRYHLQLWCEAEGCQHPVEEEGKGKYELAIPKEWLVKAKPYISTTSKMLKVIGTLGLPSANWLFGEEEVKEAGWDNVLTLAKGVGSELTPEIKGQKLLSQQEMSWEEWRAGLLSEEERAGLLQLQQILREKDPNHQHLGLTRLPTPQGEFRWLCKKHYDDYVSRVPEDFEKYFGK
jgi:Leucine-rich repeat (LRR) protein